MRITRLHVRNFRVYEDDLDLELPPGLVGIYGVNGSGKSTLLDAIRWALWGQARTPKDEIRTSGVNADCLTELEFEHEGHLYLVRRTPTGSRSPRASPTRGDSCSRSSGWTTPRSAPRCSPSRSSCRRSAASGRVSGATSCSSCSASLRSTRRATMPVATPSSVATH